MSDQLAPGVVVALLVRIIEDDELPDALRRRALLALWQLTGDRPDPDWRAREGQRPG
jgi:uncharacterized protein (UPF0147 family)